MKINLQDPVKRLLVQEYTNAMLNSQTDEELDLAIHKLIHTYQVVDVARELVALTKPDLPKDVQKTIIDAAVLHDIGRVKQFVDGQFTTTIDHALAGAEYLEKVMPENKTLIETTRWHSRSPSDNDPKEVRFYLDYVRDADILANVIYKCENMDKIAKNNRVLHAEKTNDLYIDPEVLAALKEKRAVRYKDLQKNSFLTNMLSHLHWKFNLSLDISKEYAHLHKVFTRFRDALVYRLMPTFYGTDQEKRLIVQKILDLYTDDLLNEI